MDKIRILFLGDSPTIPTGFSRVLGNIIKFLPQEDYDITILGVNHYGDPYDLPYRIYPPTLGNPQDLYGLHRVREICEKHAPQIIFMINDAWILQHYLNELKAVYNDESRPKPKIVTYIPVDARDHDSDWYNNFDFVDKVVVYTEFGKEVVLKAAPQLEEKLVIMPHGVDTKTFFKIPAEKRELKQSFYPDKAEFYDDSFIVLSAQRNQPRKKLDITMHSFSLFSKGKPDNVKLYMHCGVQDMAVDVMKLAKRFDIATRLILTNLSTGTQRVPDKFLNMIYNVTDVGVNTSLGEGWNLPCIEHAITGAPQVVPDHSAFHALYEDCGLLVPTSNDWVIDNIETTGRLVRAEDVAEKLEMLYQDRGLCFSLSTRALNKFLDKEYSWKNISERWDKLFREIL